MFKLENNRYLIEEFQKLGVNAFYSTKDLDFLQLEKSELKDKKIVHVFQTHTSNILHIDENYNMEKIPESDFDGMITSRKDIAMYTKHADCQAIYYYDKKTGAIGLCHAGWKGSYYEIATKMVDLMIEKLNSKKEDILIGIGIGICSENYQVSEDFYQDFSLKFSKEIVKKSFILKEEKYYFDNGLFNYLLLEEYGIEKENLILSNICTFKEEKLHSHRRDKEKAGRNRAYIYLG